MVMQESVMNRGSSPNDIINFPYIDYIVKAYSPRAQFDVKKYKFIQMDLFRQALTHPSMCNNESDPNYQRIEYLGDAIFHLIVSEYEFKRYEDENKGFLTKLRIKLERGESMTQLTHILKLNFYIQYRNISLNDDILEDVFEAFVGAFYLNFGITHTRTFIISLLETHKDFAMLIAIEDNYKDLLLQYFHKMKYSFPKYIEGSDEKGRYISIVKNPFGKILGQGVSRTKLKAEQLASKHALIKVGVIIGDEEIDPDWINRIDLLTDSKNIKKQKIDDKEKMSVYNPNNKLMKRSDITEILSMYNIEFPKNVKPNYKIFNEAMTHKSYLKRKGLTEKDKKCAKNAVQLQSKSNERLQFFGDAVIHFVIGELLYQRYPDRDEGFMTRLRCKLENAKSLFYLGKQIGIDKYILLSQNIDVLYDNRNNINIVKGALEAFIGALYFELGLTVAREFMLEVIRIELDIDQIAEKETNYKEVIAHIYKRNGWGNVIYEKLDQTGPDHKTVFTMGLMFRDQLMTKGTDNSKKGAEQIAAKKMHALLLRQKII